MKCQIPTAEIDSFVFTAILIIIFILIRQKKKKTRQIEHISIYRISTVD